MLKEELKKLADKITESITLHPESWKITTRGKAGIAISKGSIYIGVKTGALTIYYQGLPLFPDKIESANYYLALEKVRKGQTEKFRNQRELEDIKKIQSALREF